MSTIRSSSCGREILQSIRAHQFGLEPQRSSFGSWLCCSSHSQGLKRPLELHCSMSAPSWIVRALEADPGKARRRRSHTDWRLEQRTTRLSNRTIMTIYSPIRQEDSDVTYLPPPRAAFGPIEFRCFRPQTSLSLPRAFACKLLSQRAISPRHAESAGHFLSFPVIYPVLREKPAFSRAASRAAERLS